MTQAGGKPSKSKIEESATYETDLANEYMAHVASDVSRGAQPNFNKFAEIIDKAWNADKSVLGKDILKSVSCMPLSLESWKSIQEQR